MLKHNSWKFITRCWPRIMFIIICCPKTSPHGCAMVKNLTFQFRAEDFKSPHLQPRVPWLLRRNNCIA